jgi:hypothetical protein
MYVAVVHKISDPEKFWSMGGFPETITFRATFPNPTGTRAVCLFEASSVNTLKDFLEAAVGAVSDNEYYEVAADKAVGLPGSPS